MPDSYQWIDTAAVSVFTRLAELERTQIMGRYDEANRKEYNEMMASRPEIAREPWLGMIGPRYREGGIALVGINGGLGSSRHRSMMSAGPDFRLAEATRSFRNRPSVRSLTEYFDASLEDVKSWGSDSTFFSSTIAIVLRKLKLGLAEIAYTNVVPFRTKDSGALGSRESERSCALYLRPWLESVKPNLVIWLGTTARDKARRYLMIQAESVAVSRRRDLSAEEKFAELDEYLNDRPGRHASQQRAG